MCRFFATHNFDEMENIETGEVEFVTVTKREILQDVLCMMIRIKSKQYIHEQKEKNTCTHIFAD